MAVDPGAAVALSLVGAGGAQREDERRQAERRQRQREHERDVRVLWCAAETEQLK